MSGANASGPEERELNGVIVSAMVGSEPRTIHVGGLPPREALVEAIRQLEEFGSFRIRAISTPNTVYGDLRGYRRGIPPEAQLLGKIGRADLIP